MIDPANLELLALISVAVTISGSVSVLLLTVMSTASTTAGSVLRSRSISSKVRVAPHE